MTSFIKQMAKLSTEHESEETERKEKEAELMKNIKKVFNMQPVRVNERNI